MTNFRTSKTRSATLLSRQRRGCTPKYIQYIVRLPEGTKRSFLSPKLQDRLWSPSSLSFSVHC